MIRSTPFSGIQNLISNTTSQKAYAFLSLIGMPSILGFFPFLLALSGGLPVSDAWAFYTRPNMLTPSIGTAVIVLFLLLYAYLEVCKEETQKKSFDKKLADIKIALSSLESERKTIETLAKTSPAKAKAEFRWRKLDERSETLRADEQKLKEEAEASLHSL